MLIHAEKPNQFLYLLFSGRLRIHLKLELDSVAILEPGEVVGELSLIDRQLTSAYVVAEDDCSLLVLDCTSSARMGHFGFQVKRQSEPMLIGLV